MDKYEYQYECATIQDDTGTTGLISEPQLEPTAILRVTIECHRYCYMISRQLHAFECNQRVIVLLTVKIALNFALCNYLTVTCTIVTRPAKIDYVSTKNHQFLVCLLYRN